ncbi:MAG: YdeI/OmpD-associated family protein [Anaerolineales bacterium]|jgi:uncharacterized protein YdeI (YjbR/CyaY-like superfamily)
MDDVELLTFANRAEWRAWLQDHHHQSGEAWLVFFKKGVRQGSLTLDEAVQEALCFGWIDGRLRSLDQARYSVRFTPRRADSVWSISNIQRVEKLIQEGLMTEAGMAKVEQGHRSGQWEAAIRRERTDLIPPDLEKALRRKKGALAGYRNLTDSRKKQLLHWLLTAKKPETRNSRIQAIVSEVIE